MASDCSARCRALRKHDDPRHRRRVPAEPLPGDLRSVADLDVERSKEPIQRAQLGLDFDHEQRRLFEVPSEHVDRASVAIDGERHLDLGDPAQALEDLDDETDQPRMDLVEESIEPRALIPGNKIESRSNSVERRAKLVYGYIAQLAALEHDDLPPADARALRHVSLAHPGLDPQLPVNARQLVVSHARRIRRRPSLTLIGRLSFAVG